MQIPTRYGHAGMSRRVADLGQCSAAVEDVAYESVAAVMNGQMLQSVLTEHAARLEESPPQREA